MTGPINTRPVFTVACLAMLLFGLVVMALGSVLPVLIKNFALNETEAGLLTSILPTGVLAGSLIFGPIVDRYSYRIFLMVCNLVIIWGIESLAFADSYSLLILAFFLIGLGGGALNGSINALVADISIGDSNKKSANLSFLGVFYGLGALGMPTIMGVLNSRYSYQEIFASLGVLALFLFPVIWTIVFPKPKHIQGLSLKESLKLIKEAPLVLLGLFMFFEGGLEGAIGNWSTVFLENIIQLSPTRALFGLSTFMLCLTLTRLILAGLLNRVRPYQIMILSIVLIGLGILATYIHTNPIFPLVGLGLLGTGIAACFPVILGYVGTLYANLSGTAFSLIFAFALSGNILVNYLVGVISLQFTLNTFPVILLGCLFFMFFLLFFSLQSIKNRTRL